MSNNRIVSCVVSGLKSIGDIRYHIITLLTPTMIGCRFHLFEVGKVNTIPSFK